MKSVLLSLLFIGVLAGCKKSDERKEDTIIGKWRLERFVENETINGTVDTDEEAYSPGDYIEFREDGTCTIVADGDAAETRWQVVNNKVLFTDPDDIDAPAEGFEIKTLTKNTLTLYYKEVDDTSTYETFVYLTR